MYAIWYCFSFSFCYDINFHLNSISSSSVCLLTHTITGYQTRFLGFSLYISNTNDKSDWTLCFKDSNFTVSSIPDVFTTTCTVHGQYVIYYNERLYGVAYPSEYSTYAFNELCEVEIYGTEYKFSNSNVQMWSHCVQHLFHRVVFSSVDIQESTCLDHLKSLGPIDRKFHGHGKTMDLSCMNI